MGARPVSYFTRTEPSQQRCTPTSLPPPNCDVYHSFVTFQQHCRYHVLSHKVSTHLKSQFYSHPHFCMLAYSIPDTRAQEQPIDFILFTRVDIDSELRAAVRVGSRGKS